jgi:hypothetical protein
MTVDVGVRPPHPKTYLGDGVYAEFDGFHTWVWTSDGIRNSERIAFEPCVMEQLIAFAKRVGGLR